MPDQFEASREGQLTEKGLSWGYWWVTNRARIKSVFTLVLAVIAVSLFAYGAFGFADWFFGSGVAERAQVSQLTANSIPYAAWNEARAPRPLQLDSARTLRGGTGSYDFLAEATNSNALWRAYVDYHFVAAGLRTPTARAVILPGDSVWLTALGQRNETDPGAGSLEVEDVFWRRVNQHETLPDYVSWAAARLAVVAEDVEFVRPGANDPLATSRASFNLVNDTAFGYHRVPLMVTLWNGSALVGANRIVVSSLRAGESRLVEAVWFSDVTGVTRVEVKPDLDLFDPLIYMAAGR